MKNRILSCDETNNGPFHPSWVWSVKESCENRVAFQHDNTIFYTLKRNSLLSVKLFACLEWMNGELLAPEKQPSDWVIVFFQLSGCSGRLLDPLQTHGSVITGDARCVGANRGMLFHIPSEICSGGTAAKQIHGIIKWWWIIQYFSVHQWDLCFFGMT